MYSTYGNIGTDEKKESQDSKFVFSITTLEDLQEVINNNTVVVVDIYADWCGPCKSIASSYAAMAKELNNIGTLLLVKENVDVGIRSGSNDVTAVPTFLLYKNGKIVDKMVGTNLSDLRQKISKLL